MNPRLLRISAGIPLAAALAVGISNTASVKIPGSSDTPLGNHSGVKFQANGGAPASTKVPKRSTKSRNTDQSMASRLRKAETASVTVGGLVREPGSVGFLSGMTLWQAVQKAGGATEFGSMRRVKLYRDGKQKTFDLTKPAAMSEILKANDTVEVPQNTPWGS